MKRFVLIVLGTVILFVTGRSQSDLDYTNVLLLRTFKPDSLALARKIKMSVETRVHPDKRSELVHVKEFDANGYLKTDKKYYVPEKNDSLFQYIYKDSTIISVERLNKHTVAITHKVNRSSLVKRKIIDSGDLVKLELLSKHKNNPFFYASSVYEINADSTLNIEVFSDGDKVRTDYNINMLKMDPDTAAPAPAQDSVKIGDTTVLTWRLVNKDNLYVVNRYFVQEIKDPVKYEYLKYIDDSLAYYQSRIWKYKTRRLVFYGESQGPPIKMYFSEETVYDRSGGKTVYRYERALDGGVPNYIWQYNKFGQLVSATKNQIVYKQKNHTRYYYNRDGLLIKEKYWLNDVYQYSHIYKYEFY